MRLLITCILAFILLAPCWGQAPKGKWGNVSKEELTMTHCAIDPSANAVILNNYGHYYFARHYYFSAPELRSFYHYQVRLKIFNDEGKKHATISIPYRGYDEYEDVVEISGTTYNLDDNGKIVKTKLKVKTVERKRNGRNLWNCTFTLPDVKPGSVIEYSYKIASLDFAKLRDWMFQTSVPVLESEITHTTPNFYRYAFFSNMPQNQLEVNRNDENLYLQFYSTNIYCYGTKLRLSARNIPAFRKEVLMPDSSRQILKGEFLLSSAITRPPEFNHIRDYYLMPYLKPLLQTTTDDLYELRERHGLYIDILAGYRIVEGMDWESFVKKLSKKEEFGKTLLKAFECKWLIDSFRRIENGEKRMVAIYDFVKHYMKWNGEYRIFAGTSLEKSFEKRTGYSSDINMLLINLLSRSGIQAKPVLISTRSHGNIYKELGFLRKFNHVLVSVDLGGKMHLLDATDPLRPYNLLSVDDINGEGLLVNNLDFKWVPLVNNSVSVISTIESISVNSQGKVERTIIVSEKGYSTLEKKYLEQNNSFVADSLISPGFELRKVSVRSSIERNELATRVTDFSVESPLSMKDSSIHISLLPAYKAFVNPLHEEERLHPIDLGYERIIQRTINIPVPEGFKVAFVPANEAFEIGDNILIYSRIIQLSDNNIQVGTKLEINQSYIPAILYPDLKLFFERVEEKEMEQVAFTKGI